MPIATLVLFLIAAFVAYMAAQRFVFKSSGEGLL